MTSRTRPKASAATNSLIPTPVGDIIKHQRATLRRLMDEWQISVGLSSDQRRVVLQQQRRRVHRRALRYAKQGDDVGARALLGVNEQFLQRAKDHPRELVMGSAFALAVEPEIQQYLQRIKGIDDVPKDALASLDRLRKPANLFAHMLRTDEISRKTQSDRAARPRPKKAPSQRSEVIKAMRRARAAGEDLPGFLAAADNGSIKGAMISPAAMVGVRKYEIECGNAPSGNAVSLRTLFDWWKEAGKRAAD